MDIKKPSSDTPASSHRNIGLPDPPDQKAINVQWSNPKTPEQTQRTSEGSHGVGGRNRNNTVPLLTTSGEHGANQSRANDTAAGNKIHEKMAELDNHRIAVRKLADKILALNDKRIALERENGDLRRQIDNYLYTSNPSFETDDIEELEHTELKRRYAMVKDKLKRQTADLKEYKDKVVELQRLLLERSNTSRSESSPIADSRSRFNIDEDKYLQRVRKERKESLEELYIKQQRVIEKLEKLVNTRNAKDTQEQRVSEVLREENNLLRVQLDALTAHNITERRHRGHNMGVNSDELSRIQEKLTASEIRTRSLEKQLDENARRWASENTKLRLQIKEAEFGLNRASPFPYRLTPLPTIGTFPITPRSYRLSGESRTASLEMSTSNKPSNLRWQLYSQT